MFTDINEYMLKDRNERRKHLKLGEECINIGGVSSTAYRGLLAHFLKTTIPSDRKIHLCHACNNGGCSNPNHLYWGTAQDNVIDRIEAGDTRTVFQKTVDKHGLETALAMARKQDHSGRISHNKHNAEDLEKYREALSKYDQTERGWVSKAAKELEVSHTQVRRMLKRLNMHA